jgi:hypothetical protein
MSIAHHGTNTDFAKGAQNGIRERDFSLFCCTFFSHFSKHLFPFFLSLFFPLSHFSLIRSQYTKSNIPVEKKIFVKRMLYKSVCFHSRQAAVETSMWIWATSLNVVI